MPARTLNLPAPDGVIDATFHFPTEGGRYPAVILLTDFRGSRPVYAALAETIAAEGYAVLLPNIYYRNGRAPLLDPAIPFDDDARGRLQGYRALLTPAALDRDVDALIAGLDTLPEADADRVGVVGYCMSGAIALRFAAAFPARILATASFHGGHLAVESDPESPHLLAPNIKARVLIGHADQDASAPPDQIARLDAALSESGVAFTTEFYQGARHGFAIADAAAYDRPAATRHFEQLIRLFGETLRAHSAATIEK
jgi:carboxymethylenebutenolidase